MTVYQRLLLYSERVGSLVLDRSMDITHLDPGEVADRLFPWTDRMEEMVGLRCRERSTEKSSWQERVWNGEQWVPLEQFFTNSSTPHCAETCYNDNAHEKEIEAWQRLEIEAIEYSRAEWLNGQGR